MNGCKEWETKLFSIGEAEYWFEMDINVHFLVTPPVVVGVLNFFIFVVFTRAILVEVFLGSRFSNMHFSEVGYVSEFNLLN